MLNRYPLWKYILLVVTTLLSLLYAVPNFYIPDPAVQISGSSSGTTIDAAVLTKVETALKDAKIEYFGAEANGKSALVRLYKDEDQPTARRRIQQSLGDDYIVALNRASTTPKWLSNLGAVPMKLGLDLAGGVHFLLEVDTASAVEKRQTITADDFKEKLRKEKIRYTSIVNTPNNVIVARFKTAEFRDQAMAELRKTLQQYLFTKVDSQNAEEFVFNAALSEAAVKEIEDYAISQNLQTLRNRVNELGVSEPIVQKQGRNRIIVELAGVQDPAEAKRVIGKTANLEFHMEALPDAMISSKEQFNWRNENEQRRRGAAWLEKQIIVTGDQVSDARSGYDPETSGQQVNITLDSVGGVKMNHATKNAIGRKMGILFIEYKNHTEFVTNEKGEQIEKNTQYIERKIISLATVQSALGYSFRITGLDAPGEASELALLLRAGALAAPMHFVEERTIGPSLGKENIKKGVTSCLWGLAVVSLFMLAVYRVFGLFANVALTVNLFMLLTILSLFGATLTLPGIAGIVLTLGIAVDANVLIYSRIREELKNGVSPQQAIHIGYERAFITILDANVTTFIMGVILFAIGTGAVKGFAITLCIGLVTSMFTSIMISRALANLFYGKRKNLQHVSV
ncbi:protein translocase subunit SecD [Cellvibrio zantedeschiae]|uniref:Protein translocase subunit SecD n=1 Tax=Cellvibrio zantedeschiae TaxID=1237077 RepID=A0ABQ3AU55_9GAMM|nr:protein translocase subunit SecD [Cellvibrio zantedeschiae]GGY67300.1 protein translocase subunit SecD [Cellvibrio zantedeschiae]